MAWENASGFGSKINPIMLGDTYLSMINNNYNNSGRRSQNLYNESSAPTGYTLNTNYYDLPDTGNTYNTYESDSVLDWKYKHNGNSGGINVVLNGTTYIESGISLGSGSDKILAFGFVINHETHKAKISCIATSGSYNHIYIYYYTESGATTLYNALVANPYDSNKSGGAGSGYIGNSLLSNKKMVGYNVPTSSAESTKTESVNEASETPVANKPKIGNGFARIKFLRDVQPQPEPGYEDILNKLQNYIIWGSWDFKTKDKKESYSGSRTISCDFPCAVLNDAQMLQSNSWTSNGTTYFCGGCRVDVNGEDNVGYDIIVSRLTDTKPIHREGVTDDACNKATQLIYSNSGGGATGIGNPAVATLPETLSYRLEYSTVKLRNALEKMIEMVVGSCDLFVNGSPWILR